MDQSERTKLNKAYNTAYVEFGKMSSELMDAEQNRLVTREPSQRQQAKWVSWPARFERCASCFQAVSGCRGPEVVRSNGPASGAGCGGLLRLLEPPKRSQEEVIDLRVALCCADDLGFISYEGLQDQVRTCCSCSRPARQLTEREQARGSATCHGGSYQRGRTRR